MNPSELVRREPLAAGAYILHLSALGLTKQNKCTTITQLANAQPVLLVLANCDYDETIADDRSVPKCVQPEVNQQNPK